MHAAHRTEGEQLCARRNPIRRRTAVGLKLPATRPCNASSRRPRGPRCPSGLRQGSRVCLSTRPSSTIRGRRTSSATSRPSPLAALQLLPLRSIGMAMCPGCLWRCPSQANRRCVAQNHRPWPSAFERHAYRSACGRDRTRRSGQDAGHRRSRAIEALHQPVCRAHHREASRSFN